MRPVFSGYFEKHVALPKLLYFYEMGLRFLVGSPARKLSLAAGGQVGVSNVRKVLGAIYDTYVLGAGIVNSVTVTFDVNLREAERRHILAECGKVLATYVPAFNPNSALDVRPVL